MSDYVLLVSVNDPIGFHARPIGQVVALVKQSGIDVQIRRPGSEGVIAASPLKLLAMKVQHGETVELVIPESAEQPEQLAASLAEVINAEAK